MSAPTERGERWLQIPAAEYRALCRVEIEAGAAVAVARVAGVRLNPLAVALDELVEVRVRDEHRRIDEARDAVTAREQEQHRRIDQERAAAQEREEHARRASGAR